jgi:hypothetical protein
MLVFRFAMIPSKPFSFASSKRAFPRFSTYPPNAVFGFDDILQSLPSLPDRLTRNVSAVGAKQIKEKIDHRSGRAFLLLLQKLKPRFACRIQRYNFTIQNR